jgi:SsrA-binding protein
MFFNLDLSEGRKYYFSVKCRDYMDNWSDVESSNGFIVDLTPPVAASEPAVLDGGFAALAADAPAFVPDAAWATSTSEHLCRWNLTDPESGVYNVKAWLYNTHIDEYGFGTHENHAPKAPRKLLLNRPEIRKLEAAGTVKGQTLVPLSLYWKGSRVKVLLAVGAGKAEYDKRQDLRKREADREIRRVTSELRRR